MHLIVINFKPHRIDLVQFRKMIIQQFCDNYLHIVKAYLAEIEHQRRFDTTHSISFGVKESFVFKLLSLHYLPLLIG